MLFNTQKYLYKYLDVPADLQPYLCSADCVTLQSLSYYRRLYMPEFKSPISLAARKTLLLISPEIDRHCLTLWCSYGIKATTITSFRPNNHLEVISV